jgi:acetyltransferase-like isoleucine patch superfamily enzyme
MDSRASAPTRPLALAQVLAAADDHARAGRHADAGLLYQEVLAAAPADPAALAGLAALGAAPAPAAPADPRSLPRRLVGRWGRASIEAAAQRPRIWKYRALSSCKRVHGPAPIVNQPVLWVGEGEIVLGEGVQFGWRRSPLFYTGYCHVEAASPAARIELGDRTEINNNAFLRSEGAGIRIGRDGLFGAHVEVFDSNFHNLDPALRQAGGQAMAPVEVEDNVFVGMGVRILKGVTIGRDSVIGAGAVVASSIPPGVIAAGNPARPVREL